MDQIDIAVRDADIEDLKAENTRLEERVKQQAAVIEQKNELIQSLMDNWIPNNAHSSIKKKNAALQPCPEVLNKVRADTVREFVAKFGRHVHGDGEFWLHELEDYVATFEQGEV